MVNVGPITVNGTSFPIYLRVGFLGVYILLKNWIFLQTDLKENFFNLLLGDWNDYPHMLLVMGPI